MAILKVHDFLAEPKPLRRRARDVRLAEFATPAWDAFITDLGETLAAHGALGLAATQVEAREGARPDNPEEVWRVFVMLQPTKDGWNRSGYVVVANPVVEARVQVQRTVEACLSFRSVEWPMRGPARILTRHQDQTGMPRAGAMSGQVAVCYLHELEHLQGRTMVDRLKRGDRQRFLAKVAEAKRPAW